MAYVDWRMRGLEITNCNCDWGCPCQFNALPTHGDCRATVAMRIEQGHFGDVPLSGLAWAVLVAWPEAIHLGRGEQLVVVDERADAAQRAALVRILRGEETEPGATIFSVFAATFETLHEPLFLPIAFEADLDRRTGGFSIEGVIDTSMEPIRNPITGDEHRVRVSLPGGFEYREAEYASGRTDASGPIALKFGPSHAHVAMVDFSTTGIG